MQLEVGNILEGKVTGITKFGAFVTFPTGEKGMVHISEVSSQYVEDIAEHLQEGQTVKVKVISITDGKVALSIKATQPQQRPQRTQNDSFNRSNGRNGGNGGNTNSRSNNSRQGQSPNNRQKSFNRGNNNNSNGRGANAPKGGFEDMLSKFMQSSDEKISDIKRSKEFNRKAGTSKRGR